MYNETCEICFKTSTTGKNDAFIYRDGGTIKRQGGQTRTKGTSIDLQLCVDLPMKA
jgi:hypothetical protein